MVTVTSSGLRSTRYWDIDSQQSIRYDNDREYVTHFRQLYAQAMQARLRGLDHVGVLLSGGLDSSSVVAMAARLNPGGRPVAHTPTTWHSMGFLMATTGNPPKRWRDSATCRSFDLPAQGTAALFYVTNWHARSRIRFQVRSAAVGSCSPGGPSLRVVACCWMEPG